MNTDKVITVIIPAQEYDPIKYIGTKTCRCYLEEALDKAGILNSVVSGDGNTRINGVWYKTIQTFNASSVSAALSLGESITVKLVKDESIKYSMHITPIK